MKPRFSILTVLVFTAYVALAFAGIKKPDSWWLAGGVLAWLLALAYLVILATDTSDARNQAFGRVSVICLAAYLLLTLFPFPINAGSNRPAMLPHVWFTAWWISQETVTTAPPPAALPGPGAPPVTFSFVPMGTRASMARELEAYSALNCALAFGILGGVLKLWHFGRQEKRLAAVPGGKA